jgi:hypothetical protein
VENRFGRGHYVDNQGNLFPLKSQGSQSRYLFYYMTIGNSAEHLWGRGPGRESQGVGQKKKLIVPNCMVHRQAKNMPNYTVSPKSLVTCTQTILPGPPTTLPGPQLFLAQIFLAYLIISILPALNRTLCSRDFCFGVYYQDDIKF